jgi:hypothetical protein
VYYTSRMAKAYVATNTRVVFGADQIEKAREALKA